MNRRCLICFLAVAALPTAAPADEKDDWRSWRGPNANGIATDGQTPPIRWNVKQNVVWQTQVPGRGHSSPTVVDDRIVLTTADEARQTQSVLAFDRETGKPLWETKINTGGFPKKIHAKNTHASPTVASNGKLLFATFYNDSKVQLAALDLDGKLQWEKSAGAFVPGRYEYGYAPSPLIHKDLVIVSGESEEAGYIAAFDQQTGRDAWRINRTAVTNYSSPIVAETGGRRQLLISGDLKIAAYDPDTGKSLWVKPAPWNVTCGTVVWNDGYVFASGGYPQRTTIAMATDGSGKIAWQNPRVKCYEQSLLLHDGYVYALDDGGVAYCLRAEDGKQMWRFRLGGNVSASPVFAGGHIYASNERGTTFVFKANPKRFESVARNQLGTESFASPTICGDRIYLRVAFRGAGGRQEWLVCIGTKDEK